MKKIALLPNRKPPAFLPWDDLERIYRAYQDDPEQENQITRTPAMVLVNAGLAVLLREKNKTTVFVKITPAGCQAFREQQRKLQAIAVAELAIHEQGQEPVRAPFDRAQNMRAKKLKGVFAA